MNSLWPFVFVRGECSAYAPRSPKSSSSGNGGGGSADFEQFQRNTSEQMRKIKSRKKKRAEAKSFAWRCVGARCGAGVEAGSRAGNSLSWWHFMHFYVRVPCWVPYIFETSLHLQMLRLSSRLCIFLFLVSFHLFFRSLPLPLSRSFVL